MRDHAWNLREKSDAVIERQCLHCGLTYLRVTRCEQDTKYWITRNGTVQKQFVSKHEKAPTIPCQGS